MKLSMFLTVPLSIIRSSPLYTRQKVYVIQLVSRIRMELSSILILLTSCQQTCMTYSYCCVYSKKLLMMEGELPETCRVLFQK